MNDNESNMETGSISILNDFCLLQILNRLDINDLCNLVNLNKQFKRVSSMSFSGRYQTFCYPDHLKMYLNQSRDSFRSQMRKVLCNFGHLIKSLKLRDFDPAGVFVGIRIYPIEMDVISKYCAGTLNELKLRMFIDFDCDQAKPLFASLKMLKISCSGLKGDASGLFSNCHELKTLKLNSVPYTESISEIAKNYPNLEELYIGSAMLNIDTMFALLHQNPQIKKLDMFNDNANKTICAVASKMEHLEELILRFRWELDDYGNVNQLGNLRSLKALEFHDINYEFLPAIAAMENVPLERFKWFGCPANLDFMNIISKLVTLKCLALNTISSPFDDWLIKLGEQLPLLEELKLGFNHQNESLFSIRGLVKFVERSSKLNSIVIHTIHSDLFSQQFYDLMLKVIQKRSTTKTFHVTIYGRYITTSPHAHSDLLQVDLVGEYCTCRHCEPNDYWEYNEYDFDDDMDYVDIE